MTKPDPELPEELVARMTGFVSAHLGLDFSSMRQRDLVRGLHAACRDLNRGAGEGDVVAWAEKLLSGSHPSREQLDVLAAHLTVGETYFFRTVPFFNVLERLVVPRLAERAGREGRLMRFWSAGCSSGEEPYSLAILLDRRRLLTGSPDVSARPVLGTDINPVSLARAALGTYSEWSFRDAPPWLKRDYFRSDGKGRHTIIPRIRRAVRFLPLNLVRDPFPDEGNGTAGLDLILCRHVLMYFRKPAADEVVRRLRLCLREGGCLIVSPTEIAHLDLSRFREERLDDTVVHWNEPPGTTSCRPVPVFAVNPLPLPAPAPAPLPLPLPLVVRPESVTMSFPAAPPPPPLPAAEAVPRAAVPPRQGSASLSGVLEEARRHYEGGEYAEAVRVLEGALSGILREGGAAGEGSAAGEGAAVVTECLLLGARSWANLGRFEEALFWSRRSAEAGRMNPEGHYLTATVLLELGRTAEAVEALRRVLYLAPDFAPAQLALARAALLNDNRDEATRLIRRLVEGLSSRPDQEEVPGSEGLTAGAIRHFARAILERAGQSAGEGTLRKGRGRR